MHSDVEMSEILKEFAGLQEDEHGTDTPRRVLDTLNEMTRCRSDHEDHMKRCVKWKTFAADSSDMIIVKDIPFVSLCNHHVLPFIGKAHVGYVPQAQIAGLSKFARVVQHFARRLQLQERLTNQIGDFLYNELEPRGLAVILEAEHSCMVIRGVKAPGTSTITSTMRGVYSDHDKTAKAELMEFVRASR